MIAIEIRDYTKRTAKGRAAGRRHTFYAVAATTHEEAKAKALRTHLRRIENQDLAATVRAPEAGASRGGKISFQIL